MGTVGNLNEESMRSIETRLGGRHFVSRVDPFPPEKPDRIVVSFHESFYPDPVTDAWVELRVRLNDDLDIIYTEEWSGTRWTCRWNRHDNNHNARTHFHPPPTITTQDAKDIDLPDDQNRAVLIALRLIEDRINDIWQTEEVIYPSEYVFDYEYGSDNWIR